MKAQSKGQRNLSSLERGAHGNVAHNAMKMSKSSSNAHPSWNDFFRSPYACRELSDITEAQGDSHPGVPPPGLVPMARATPGPTNSHTHDRFKVNKLSESPHVKNHENDTVQNKK
jgi:hypothetical protein